MSGSLFETQCSDRDNFSLVWSVTIVICGCNAEPTDKIPEFIAPHLNNVTVNYLGVAVFQCNFHSDHEPHVQVCSKQ